MGKTKKIFIPPMRKTVKKYQPEPAQLPQQNIKAQQQSGPRTNLQSPVPVGSASAAQFSPQQPDYRPDEFFLNGSTNITRTEDNLRRDVYEFQGSPGDSPSDSTRATNSLHGKDTHSPNMPKGIGKAKNAIKKDVLKNIRKMQRALASLREQEQCLLATSEQ